MYSAGNGLLARLRLVQNLFFMPNGIMLVLGPQDQLAAPALLACADVAQGGVMNCPGDVFLHLL